MARFIYRTLENMPLYLLERSVREETCYAVFGCCINERSASLTA
jgi:hypothetical protein